MNDGRRKQRIYNLSNVSKIVDIDPPAFDLKEVLKEVKEASRSPERLQVAPEKPERPPLPQPVLSVPLDRPVNRGLLHSELHMTVQASKGEQAAPKEAIQPAPTPSFVIKVLHSAQQDSGALEDRAGLPANTAAISVSDEDSPTHASQKLFVPKGAALSFYSPRALEHIGSPSESRNEDHGERKQDGESKDSPASEANGKFCRQTWAANSPQERGGVLNSPQALQANPGLQDHHNFTLAVHSTSVQSSDASNSPGFLSLRNCSLEDLKKKEEKPAGVDPSTAAEGGLEPIKEVEKSKENETQSTPLVAKIQPSGLAQNPQQENSEPSPVSSKVLGSSHTKGDKSEKAASRQEAINMIRSDRNLNNAKSMSEIDKKSKASPEKEPSISRGMKEKEESTSRVAAEADNKSVNLSEIGARNSRSAIGSVKGGRNEVVPHKTKNLQKFASKLEETFAGSTKARSNKRTSSFVEIDDSKSVKSQINEARMKKRINEQFPNLDAFENESMKSAELNDFQATLTQQVNKNQRLDSHEIRRNHPRKSEDHIETHYSTPHATYHSLVLLMAGVLLLEVFKSFLLA